MVSLATDIRPPRAVGRDALLRLAVEAGANGIHFAGGGDLEGLDPFVIDASHHGLEATSVGLPLPERPLGRGKRMPRPGAIDREERAAGVALARRGLAAGAGAGARVFVLDFGPVDLAASAVGLLRAFARRELGEDDPGAPLLEAALDERRARGAELTDACQWALEPLLRDAERLGATIVLPVGATPWDAPSPREAGELLAVYAGAPLGPAWDPGRLSVLHALGLPISDERLRALAAAAVLVVDNDAVGLRAGFLPGLGERDPRLATMAVAASATVVVTGSPDATDAEVSAALAAST